MLTIPEQLLLLQGAMYPTAKHPPKRSVYALAREPVAAACLVELVLARRVTVQPTRRSLHAREAVVVTDAGRTGDAVLDDVLQRLAGAEQRSSTYWIRRLAAGSEDACWNRLIAKSLLRPDPFSSDRDRYVPDPDAVAAITERVRAALAESGATELRDAALVVLLAHTQSLFGLLHDAMKLTPAGALRDYRTQRRVDRAGQQALERYSQNRDATSALGVDQRQARSTEAETIQRIANAAASLKGSGPGWHFHLAGSPPCLRRTKRPPCTRRSGARTGDGLRRRIPTAAPTRSRDSASCAGRVATQIA